MLRSLREYPLVRATAIRSYRLAARTVVVLPGPRVVANGIPKSGTHLLTRLLGLLPRMMFSGIHHALTDFRDYGTPGSPVKCAELQRALGRVRNGQYVSVHFPANPTVVATMAEMKFRHVLIVRDPRDIVVSQAHYVTGLRRHPLHAYFNELPDVSSRLRACIAGVPRSASNPGYPSIGEFLRLYRPWLSNGNTCVVRFERLVGRRSGAALEEQLDEVRAVARHVNRTVTGPTATKIAQRLHSAKSETFRKGQPGEWRTHFDDDHVALFEEEAGDLLREFGYAQGDDWST